MKLHLPKALLVSLISAATSIIGYAENIEVGRVTAQYSGTNGDTSTLPSQSGVYDYTATTGNQNLTLTGNDKVGTFDENGNLITTPFSKYQADDALFGSVKHSWSGNGVITQNFKVDGTLAITGSSQVILGGQYKINDEDFLASDYDEYTGVIANKVIISDNGKLQSYNAQVGTLDAQGGTVALHTGMYQGNQSMRLEGAKDSKQVQIHHALKVSGTANVTIGTTTKDGSAKDEHIATAFGSFTYVGNPELSEGEDEETDVDNYVTNVEAYNIHSSKITQEGGTLNVYGKSLSIGGLNIEQSGGTMAISTGQNIKTENNKVTQAPMCHFLADYGDSTITQSGAEGTTLSIGLIKAYNSYYDSVVKSLQINNIPITDINPSLTVSQTGTGTINLNGVYFFNQKTKAASTDKSTITQSGGGTINLNGAYEGATFDITQKDNGGTINLNGNMTAGQVSQSAGKLNIGENVTLTADSVSVGSDMTVSGSLTAAGEDSLLTIVGQGHLKNSGSIGMDILLEGGELTAVDGSTFTNVVATSGTIYLGDAVSFDSLTLGSNAEIALYTLRNAPNGVTVYVSKGGAVANDVTIGNNVTFVVETEGTAEDLVGQNLTIFQKQDGSTYNLDEAKLIVKDSTGTETELSFRSNGDGSVNITGNIPEPATATLSLLALAALAARRRR